MTVESMIEHLQSVEYLSAFSPAELQSLADGAELQRYELGARIADAGTPADGLYVIKSGRVRLFVDDNGREESIGVRKAGEVFSELSVLRESVHEYSVRSGGNTELLVLPRPLFASLFRANPAAEEYMASFAAIRTAGGVFSQLFDLRGEFTQEEVQQLIRTVGIKTIDAGSTVLEQESSDDRRLYIVRSGEVALTRREAGHTFELGKLGKGEIFGERSCLTNQPQSTAVTAQTVCTLLVLPEETMRAILKRSPRLASALDERIRQLDRELSRQQKLRRIQTTPQLSLDINRRERLGEKVLKRFPLIRQAEEMDCGAACLAMVCKYYRIPITLGKLRDLVNVTREGASLDSIANVAEGLGFTTRGVQASFAAMKGFELPLLAHWEGYHFVVVYGISNDHVWIADPGPGFRKLTIDEFEKGWTGTSLLFSPTSLNESKRVGTSPWRRFFSYLKPHRKSISHMFLAALVIQLLNLAPPIITQNVFDRVIVHENSQLLFFLIIGLVLAQVFGQLTTLMRGYLANFMTRSMDFAMMSGFFRHTLALPVAFFANRRTGDVFARFQENQTIREFLTGQTIGTVLNFLMAFVYLTVMFIYNVKLTLLLLALVMPMFVLTVAITPRMKDYSRKSFEASTEAEAILMETIGAAESIKGMGIERQARLKWEKKYANALNVQYRAQGFHLSVGVLSQLLNIAATSTVLYVGATMVIAQELSVGQLIAFNMLSTSVMAPLLGLVSLWDELHAAGVAIERLSDVLDVPPEQTPDDIKSRIVLPQIDGDVRFENLYFRYGGGNSPFVLKDISFEIKAGEMVAIVGQSGSGKSTLAKLLVGFYPPTEGRIFVDGYDMSHIELHAYRSQIGYVMQSNMLFQGSIGENIAMGQSEDEVDQQQIIAAATLADAHRFISDLPLGYDHKVGERGVGLSGGQIQRICIARAICRSPSLLVFDEATSALDTQSESNILSSMDGILEGRTAVVIAHRMSTILRADRIIVLYNGEIAEMGTHNELLARNGMYHQLVAKQISGVAA